jgi:hypothetical protein
MKIFVAYAFFSISCRQFMTLSKLSFDVAKCRNAGRESITKISDFAPRREKIR